MRIGYACVTIGPEDTQMKTCRQSNASREMLLDLIAHNLASLEKQIDYNLRMRIGLFRISSDLIPFGSSPVNRIPWWEVFGDTLEGIGQKIRAGGMRVSMHPGQYTVINSPDPGVVERAAEDLIYHARVLDSLGLGSEHKIVLHVGGVYQDKPAAVRRFLHNLDSLPQTVRRRIILENDDRSYHSGDVLAIALESGLPAVYDNLHDQVNPDPRDLGSAAVIRAFAATWGEGDGPQKIHYAQQDAGKKPGSHAQSVAIGPFLDFVGQLQDPAIDVMLEVKDKNLSAVKCILCTQSGTKIRDLEEEWKRYKYKVLEKSQTAYDQIRALLSDKTSVNPLAFYRLLEEALNREDRPGSRINAAMHVWGYFRKAATTAERNRFLQLVEDVEKGRSDGRVLKNFLLRLALRYEQPYLKESYYFYL